MPNNYTKCSKILSQSWHQTSIARFQSEHKCTVWSLQKYKTSFKAHSKAIPRPPEHELTSQGFSISSIIKFASPRVTSYWSTVQQNMPKNIVIFFFLKYLTNTWATCKNLFKLSIGKSSVYSFCLQSETLKHIFSSCKLYLDQGRYTWRHDSVLNFIANTLSALPSCSIYDDLPVFLSPSLVAINSLWPDLLLITKIKTLYILELTIGFETSIKFNNDCKVQSYSSFIMFNILSNKFH